MIFPVKILDRHGNVKQVISSKQLQERNDEKLQEIIGPDLQYQGRAVDPLSKIDTGDDADHIGNMSQACVMHSVRLFIH